MNDLKNIKKLTENGKYKLVGFMLEKTPENEEEEKVLGVCLNFWKDEKDNFFFTINSDIAEACAAQPYGQLQTRVSNFNSSFDIEIKDGKYHLPMVIKEPEINENTRTIDLNKTGNSQEEKGKS